MSILIADDDPLQRALLTRSLSTWGYDHLTACDGDEAWRLASREPRPTMAILDWEMPGLSGPAVCARIRQTPALANMHVILLTSRASLADRVAGLDAGADDFVIKPFAPTELWARLRVGVRVTTLQGDLSARVLELEDALSQVRCLRGLLPICAYCKRIRTDGNYWEQIESYVSAHSQAEFSHGICPACYTRVEQELYRRSMHTSSEPG